MADTTIISTKSTWINEGATTTNYGTLDDLYVGKSGAGYLFYILAEFDLTTCPLANKIKTALMLLNAHSIVGSGCSGTIERNTASWVETAVTWATKPASTGNYGTIALTSTGAKSVDVTDLIKEWKAGTYDNYGIKITTTAAAGNSSICRSDEYATEAERPRLLITPKPSGGILFFLSEAYERNKKLWTPKLLLPKEGYSC